MTRCPEFYDKLEKDGNFCHLSPGAISQIKAYNELRSKIGKHIPDKDLIVNNFPEGAGRVLSSVKDDDTRDKGLNYVVACLKRGEMVTAGDLKNTINGWLKDTGKSCSTNARSEKFTNVKTKPPLPVENLQKPAGFPEPVPPAPCTVPCKGDPSGASGPVNLGDEIRKREMEQAGRNQHVGHGPDVSVTPAGMFAPDHIRESPFRTAAEIKQKQDGGIAGEMFDEEGRKQRIEQLLEEAIGLMPDYTKRCAAAIFEHHKTGWKHPYANLIYHAVEALLEKETMSQVRK